MCIDEATDASNHSSICIVVRYLDEEEGEIKDTLWDLVPSYQGDENKAEANAPYIAETVLNSFRNAEVPLCNIMAFCSDTCPLMMGSKNGVAAIFKRYIPDIKIVKCECHLGNLIARDAMKKLPPQVMDLIAAMPKYVKKSAISTHMWKGLQEKTEVKSLPLVMYAKTRWTSRYAVSLRVVRRWELLAIFFEREVQVNPTKNAGKGKEESNEDTEKQTPEWIHAQLQDPLMYAYALFLEAMLSRLANANEILQSQKPIVSDYKSIMAKRVSRFFTYVNE